jgi:hypothetical protein
MVRRTWFDRLTMAAHHDDSGFGPDYSKCACPELVDGRTLTGCAPGFQKGMKGGFRRNRQDKRKERNGRVLSRSLIPDCPIPSRDDLLSSMLSSRSALFFCHHEELFSSVIAKSESDEAIPSCSHANLPVT